MLARGGEKGKQRADNTYAHTRKGKGDLVHQIEKEVGARRRKHHRDAHGAVEDEDQPTDDDPETAEHRTHKISSKKDNDAQYRKEDAYLRTEKGKDDLRVLVRKMIIKHGSQVADRAIEKNIEKKETRAVEAAEEAKDSKQDKYLKTKRGQKELKDLVKTMIAKHASVEWKGKRHPHLKIKKRQDQDEEKVQVKRLEKIDSTEKAELQKEKAALDKAKPVKVARALGAFKNPYVGVFLAIALCGACFMLFFLILQDKWKSKVSNEDVWYDEPDPFEEEAMQQERRRRENSRIREEAFSPQRNGIM